MTYIGEDGELFSGRPNVFPSERQKNNQRIYNQYIYIYNA